MVNSSRAAKKISFVSFDAVIQRRQHALVPHRGFHPRTVSALSLCALCSPCGHCRRLTFALPRCVCHAFTFLSPFPRYGFASRTFSRSPRNGTMETLTPARLTCRAGLPAYCATPSRRSVSNHAVRSDIAWSTTPAYRTLSGLRRGIAGSPPHYAESSSFTYGPTVRLRLLSTPLRADAVTLGYVVAGARLHNLINLSEIVVAGERGSFKSFKPSNVFQS